MRSARERSRHTDPARQRAADCLVLRGTVRGSSAMPHIGQLGPGRTISASQVYSARVAATGTRLQRHTAAGRRRVSDNLGHTGNVGRRWWRAAADCGGALPRRRRRSHADRARPAPDANEPPGSPGLARKSFQAMGTRSVCLPAMIHRVWPWTVPRSFHKLILQGGRRFGRIIHSRQRRHCEIQPNHIRFIRLYNRLLWLKHAGRGCRPHTETIRGYSA